MKTLKPEIEGLELMIGTCTNFPQTKFYKIIRKFDNLVISNVVTSL